MIFPSRMNKLVIELSGYLRRWIGGERVSRNSKSIRSGSKLFELRVSGCRGSCIQPDGDRGERGEEGGSLFRAIMLQIYIPKAIEQSCWMCTLGRDCSALPTPVPLPSSRHLENHHFHLLAPFFLSSSPHHPRITTLSPDFSIFCGRRTMVHRCSSNPPSIIPIRRQFFIPLNRETESTDNNLISPEEEIEFVTRMFPYYSPWRVKILFHHRLASIKHAFPFSNRTNLANLAEDRNVE